MGSTSRDPILLSPLASRGTIFGFSATTGLLCQLMHRRRQVLCRSTATPAP